MRGLFGIIISVVVILSIPGCSTGECDGNRNSLPYAEFYAMSDSVMKPISLDSISIYGIGAPEEAMLADTAINLEKLYLPFDIESESTSFVIKYVNSLAPKPDTITFDYTATPYFVSDECGAVYIYHLSRIATTHNAIDSVVCPGMKIDNQAKVNIKIYFNTGRDEETRATALPL